MVELVENKQWMDYKKLIQERPDAFRQADELEIVTDEAAVSKFMEESGREIGMIYRSPYNILLVDLVRDSQGKLMAYERILSNVPRGAVVIVPFLNGDYVVLRQFRHSLREFQYAFPRGFGEKEISPEQNVKKELCEEIGADTVTNLHHCGQVVADSGLCGNKVDVYSCQVNRIKKDSDMYEGIKDICVFSEEAMRQMISNGEITDGFTLAALLLFQSPMSVHR